MRRRREKTLGRRATETKKAETEAVRKDRTLIGHEGLISAAVEVMLDGVMLVNMKGKLVYMNRACENMFGYERKDFTGKSVLELPTYSKSRDRDKARNILKEVIGGSVAEQVDMNLITKYGNEKPVSFTVSVVRDNKGNPEMLVAVIRDVTEKKRIESEILDYTRQIETLFDVGLVLNRTLNLTELLDSILDKVLGLMNVEAGGIFLFDKENDELNLKKSRGTSEEFIKKVEELRIIEGFSSKAARSRKPLIIENVASDPRMVRMGVREEGIVSFAAVPIIVKDRILGVIGVGSYQSREVPDREIQLLITVAGQIGMAIENARLYEQALELAFTDGLTGLYNRRYLMEQIEREFSRAERGAGSLSLIMIDLDGLKTINDRYGHHEGDAVLKGLGSVIKDNTRASDTAARWGGDEFMILAPETGSERARKIGERIRYQVERFRPVMEGEEIVLSISIGIASYPSHAVDVTQLLQRVDEAMYSAKRGGRNRLSVFSK